MTSRPAAATAPDELRTLGVRLRLLRRFRGDPSLRMMAKRTGPAPISHSTVDAVLRCDTLPSWEHVDALVTALGGDVAEFRDLWLAVRNAQAPIDSLPAAATVRPAPTTEQARAAEPETESSRADVVVRTRLWLEDMRSDKSDVPDTLLRGDPAALDHPIWTGLAALLRGGTAVDLVTHRGLRVPVTSADQCWSTLLCDLVLFSGGSGRRWLMRETIGLLAKGTPEEIQRVQDVWACLYHTYLSPAGAGYDDGLLDAFVDDAATVSAGRYKWLFKRIEFLLDLVSPDPRLVQRLAAALQRYERGLGDDTSPALLERVNFLIGRAQAIVFRDATTVRAFQPALSSVNGTSVCPYEFEAMSFPLTVEDLSQLAPNVLPMFHDNPRMPYVFVPPPGSRDSAQILAALARDVRTVVTLCARAEADIEYAWDIPTMAEWTALAGCDENEFPWGPQRPDPELANLKFDGWIPKIKVVGSYRRGRSRFNTYDCCGNVYEIVRARAQGEFPTAYRLAGGCYTTKALVASCAHFGHFSPREGREDRRRNVGLRLIRYRRVDEALRWDVLAAFVEKGQATGKPG